MVFAFVRTTCLLNAVLQSKASFKQAPGASDSRFISS